ncbi:MAG: hypothetical protein HN742_04120 [Lentisphaerae bacterium]|jgi:hypothetical protein|nr:hypothetical protein [Lentisphaerota bacterium]MBT4822098.1 hypothetical protein [Lentisphaerota bacterium]MBT5604849.1 hypothetical protein [Lentisphaerota bacterium]MBT7054232.1 hypothetical protein [Lentisphaerota bacterium]MBT7841029.1 hypothetical protein [Lentisphaerota bacterium]
MPESNDVSILRDLAKRYAEIAAKPIQEERRELWRAHNSLERTRPLVLLMPFACWGEFPESQQLVCEDPFLRGYEQVLRRGLVQDSFGDDTIVEPWIMQRAALVTPPGGLWGVPFGRIPSSEKGGAWKFDPPLKELEDIDKLVAPQHEINEEATARNVNRLREAIGDILDVNVDRTPAYTSWAGDISTHLAYLRDIGQMMWDMVDNPEWLHRLCSFMSEGVLRTHDQAEAAGDWHLADHKTQAMSYCRELEDPTANSAPVTRDKLWTFFAAQEMAQVGPAMHEEFCLRYQMPMMEKFGLVSYGCCEDLTHKIDMLRKVPGLRRISVTPVADPARCAEQIGTDYVISWRPNPAQMICCGFDPDLIRKVVRDAMDAFRVHNCHVDINLKDVQTVQGHPENLRRWVEIVREITDEYV